MLSQRFAIRRGLKGSPLADLQRHMSWSSIYYMVPLGKLPNQCVDGIFRISQSSSQWVAVPRV